jgi:hypothetical protein
MILPVLTAESRSVATVPLLAIKGTCSLDASKKRKFIYQNCKMSMILPVLMPEN